MAARSALIVANGEYQSAKLRKLRAPAVDAETLARVLGDPAIGDFEVELVRDEPEHVLRRRIARFFADRRRDDLLLLHLSCHGLKDDDGHLFFATPDTEIDDLDSTAVPEDFVRRQMSKSRSGCIVLLLDCCYSGAFSRGMTARAGGGVELKERFAARGRAVITASNSMEYAFEGDDLSGVGEPSVFTRALVNGLETGRADRDRDGWVGFDELYDYVYDEVRGASPQHPLKWVDLEGDVRIAKSPHAQAPIGELAPDLRAAIDNPDRHTRLGAVQVLAELMTGADAAVAQTARQTLEHLTSDDSRLVADAARRSLAGGGTAVAADVTEGQATVDTPEPQREPEPTEVSEAEPTAIVAPHPAATDRLDVSARVRAASIAAIAGAIVVIASLIPHSRYAFFTRFGFRGVVALISLGVIGLMGIALVRMSRTPRLVGMCLAFALMGVVFPMSWSFGQHPKLPTFPAFWVRVLAAGVVALAALAAVLATTPDRPAASADSSPAARLTPARVLVAITGAGIAIVALFSLPEWRTGNTVWQNWTSASYRYPATIIVLSLLVAVLSVAALRQRRDRLLVGAAAAAWLLLGQAVPLIFIGAGTWGLGRWLGIAGAGVTAVSLMAAVLPRRRLGASSEPRWSQLEPAA